MSVPIWHVYGVERIEGAYRFSVRLRTSLGPVYLHGFRLTDKGKLYPPGYRKGKGWAYTVKLPKNAMAAIKNKVLKIIRSLEEENDRRVVAGWNAGDRLSPATEIFYETDVRKLDYERNKNTSTEKEQETSASVVL